MFYKIKPLFFGNGIGLTMIWACLKTKCFPILDRGINLDKYHDVVDSVLARSLLGYFISLHFGSLCNQVLRYEILLFTKGCVVSLTI